MNPKTLPLLFLLLLALAFGTDRLSAQLSVTNQEEARTGDQAASESLPVIDFPLLDQARPLDLIDMDLDFPEALKKLEGQRVSLVGFMAPFDNLQNMRRCMILPSYVGCNFCSPPKLSQVVYVTQGGDDESRTFRFIEEPSHVEGILRISLPGSDHEGQRQGFVYSIEDAVVTRHTSVARDRAPIHGIEPHDRRATSLAPLAMEDLIRQVADLLGRQPLHPIKIESVSLETLEGVIRTELKTTFPEATGTARSRAFFLLGLLREDDDLIDTILEYELARRVTATDDAGGRIYLLASVPDNHPYVRLELVGEIADSLTKQHFARDQIEAGADNSNRGLDQSDDARRALEALHQGIRIVAMNRYAVSHGISPFALPPIEFVEQSLARRRAKEGIAWTLPSYEFRAWQSLPYSVGLFFVESFVGTTGPISEVDTAIARPPTTTMEFFRPRWYRDASLWRQNPVPRDFADNLMDTPPILTDVLGIGGLVPLLTKWYSVDVAKSLAGGWAGDRWAFWQLPDGASALMLEIRWRDESSAIQFREAIPEHSLWSLPPHRAGSTRVRLLRADSADAIDRLTSAVQAASIREEAVNELPN